MASFNGMKQACLTRPELGTGRLRSQLEWGKKAEADSGGACPSAVAEEWFY